MSMKIPEKGFYYHYKHTGRSLEDYAYEVLNIAHHTEVADFNNAAMVVYRPLYREAKVFAAGKRWDVRPLRMFLEEVTKGGKTFPRFSRITDPDAIAHLKRLKREMYGE
jgi:hypothetical protein